VDLDVGGQEAIAAVGEAAESFRNAIVAHHRLQADNQFSEAQRQVQEALDLFADNLERDPDTTTFDLRFKEVMGSMKQFAPRNPLAARAFSKLLANVKVNGQRMMLQSKLATERDLFYANRAGEMAQGKFDIAEKKLKKGVRQGLISNKQAQVMLTNIAGERKEADKQKWINVVREQAKLFNTEDEALDFIDSAKDLTLGEKASLRTAESADRNREETAKDEAYDDYVEGVTDNMVQNIDNPDYNIDAVLADPKIETADKRSFVEDYKAFSTATIPETSDFDAVERVKIAQDAFAMGKTVTVDDRTFKADKQYARQVLKENWKDLDSSDRKKYRNEIYEKQDSLHGKYRGDGRYFLKEAFLTGRTVSAGGFAIRMPKGPEEQRRYEQASNELEVLLEDYRTSGKWPTSLDFYKEVKTIEAKVKDPNYGVLLTPLQRRIESIPIEERQSMGPEEVDALRSPIGGKPVRKGPTNQGQLVLENNTPVMVFDESGKEIGLEMKDGGVFEIGSRIRTKEGKVLEYTGDGQWKAVE
jgi:hypothetical protein